MADSNVRAYGAGAIPTPDRGHPLPRRTSPEMSVTLRHHRLTRDASMRSPPRGGAEDETGSKNSPRRNLTDDSHETAQSDGKKWFDRSNRNPYAPNASSMDIDPPFFQKETDSSIEELRNLEMPSRSPNPGVLYTHGARQIPLMRPTVTHSSSADDYRSVIDDLTIENKRLKEELKRYRQFGPDLLKKDKLFEIKVHGLPKRKKRELEAKLRDFAAGLEGSTESSSRQNKQSRHAKNLYSSMESTSKHASSSSSHSRPVDSAYASMSTGPSSAAHSSGTSLTRPPVLSHPRSSEQKVESYLQDIPDGLLPRHLELTDKEKKKLVVRRLEQLFTGKIAGKNLHRNQSMPDMEAQGQEDLSPMRPPRNPEAAREATIMLPDASQKKARSRDNQSSSNSRGDQTECRGNGNGSASGGRQGSGPGTITTPPIAPLPEQRPTRPRDLDPDRAQIPTENMEYIRHLGLVPPELLAGKKAHRHQDVSPDADGWVYLNLLCNMAQLHMINVTPDFIRLAVTEKSTKFQLSSDGRKIRWRGGTAGTKFSSDSSGDNSQKSPSTDDTDASNESGQRKKQKTQRLGTATTPSPLTKNVSKFRPQLSGSSDSFHYKPLFVRKSSSIETSLEDTVSQASYGQAEESNIGNTSRWDYSGSGSSQRKKRRHDGAIIFYGGAPFCTDLSGDPGDVSPTTYLTNSGQEPQADESDPTRPAVNRTTSGSSLPFRPLSDRQAVAYEPIDVNVGVPPDLVADESTSTSEPDLEFPWCDEPEEVKLAPLEPTLEPCGLGGVLPDDHFAVIVTTRRPITAADRARKNRPNLNRPRLDDTVRSVVGRLATTRASSPASASTRLAQISNPSSVQIEYLSGRFRRLKPIPLPPPGFFYPSLSTDSTSSGDDGVSGSENDEDENLQSSASLISQRANPHLSDNTYPDDQDLSSNDEEDEVDPNEEFEFPFPAVSVSRDRRFKPSKPRKVASGNAGSVGGKAIQRLLRTGSSVATAGDAESGYNSSVEYGEG